MDYIHWWKMRIIKYGTAWSISNFKGDVLQIFGEHQCIKLSRDTDQVLPVATKLGSLYVHMITSPCENALRNAENLCEGIPIIHYQGSVSMAKLKTFHDFRTSQRSLLFRFVANCHGITREIVNKLSYHHSNSILRKHPSPNNWKCISSTYIMTREHCSISVEVVSFRVFI